MDLIIFQEKAILKSSYLNFNFNALKEAIEAMFFNEAALMLPFAGEVIPDGWLLCDGSAISRETYSDLYSKIGTKYGVGDGSTTFNLPDYRNKTFWGGDTTNVGTVKSSALPNITGSIDRGSSVYTIGILSHGSLPASGSLTVSEYATVNYSTQSGSALRVNGISIDASRSSSIYKNGQTIVQPPAIQVPIIIKY